MSYSKTPEVRAVIFDFDGTLTAPGSLNFGDLRNIIACPANQPVLEFINSLKENERLRALEILDDFELKAAEISRPNTGAELLLAYLDRCRIPYGIVSRNSLGSVLRALENFPSVSPTQFKTLITRDDNFAPKPDPASICEAAKRLGVSVEATIAVGDFVYDVEAGKRAGALTVYLSNGHPTPSFHQPPDVCVSDLCELKQMIALHRPLSVGKLPNQLLEEILDRIDKTDLQLLIGPRVGEDVAAIALRTEEEVIVLKSDPITFATSRLGYYSVLVNANDIVTSGATPRWLLATLLLPEGSNAASAQTIIAEINEFCVRNGIQLCGGHTEITEAVTQPLVVAQLTGTVARSRLLDKRRIQSTDRILMTNKIAVEGTAILALEFPQKLLDLGLSELELSRAQKLLEDPGISILQEAELACSMEGIVAMHDVTEGGIATALHELSIAANRRFVVDLSKIQILPETEKICRLLGLDPLGLIGSGSLLIVCTAAGSAAILSRLREAGIPAEELGSAAGSGRGVDLLDRDESWPSFEKDEISRAFEILT